MLKDIEVLQKQLEKIIQNNVDNKEFFQGLLEKTEGKFRGGLVADLFNQNISFYTLTADKCYWLADAIHEINRKVNPKIFFTDKEINEIKINKLDATTTNTKSKTEIELNNMKVMEEGHHWSGAVTYEEWADLLSNNFFMYKAGELQREGKKKVVGSKVITSPFVNYASVREINKEMLNKNYVPDTITISCVKTDIGRERDYILVNKESERNTETEMEKGRYPYNDILIKINSECPIYLTDGMHRSIAIQRTVEEARKTGKKDVLNQLIKIDFTYWDFSKTQQFIYQMQQGNKMTKAYTKTLANTNNAMNLAKELNREGNEGTNELYNRLVTNNLELKYTGYTLLNTFADSLEMAFGELLDKPRHYRKVKKFIINFYNELIGILKDKYEVEDLKELRDLIVTDNNMFVFYNGIATVLYENKINDSDLSDLLEMLIDEIDWNKSNPQWEDNGILSDIVTSKATFKKILRFADEKIREVM